MRVSEYRRFCDFQSNTKAYARNLTQQMEYTLKFKSFFFPLIADTKSYVIQMGEITWVTKANVVSLACYVKSLA